MAGAHEFLMVADSKLVSCSNIIALLQAGVEFIARSRPPRSRTRSMRPWT
ncbi:hypothetical protein [Streptomyces sp. SYSU K217416]